MITNGAMNPTVPRCRTGVNAVMQHSGLEWRRMGEMVSGRNGEWEKRRVGSKQETGDRRPFYFVLSVLFAAI